MHRQKHVKGLLYSALILLVLISACQTTLAPEAAQPTTTSLTRTMTSVVPYTQTPFPAIPTTPWVYTPVPLTSIPTLSCETHTASVVLSASDVTLKVGEAVKVTATLRNEGCVQLGLPQYLLYIQSDRPESLFTPDNPEPVVHYLGVAPGQSDTVDFDLQAVATGQATLTASASFEVHLGYPGPAYWGYSSTGEALVIHVAP